MNDTPKFQRTQDDIATEAASEVAANGWEIKTDVSNLPKAMIVGAEVVGSAVEVTQIDTPPQEISVTRTESAA